MPAVPQNISPTQRPLELATAAGLIVLYYLAARWGLESAALRYAPVTLIWPASGIALAMVLRFGPRPWPVLFAAAVAATWPTIHATPTGTLATDIGSVLLIGATAVIEPVLAGWAIARFARGAFLERASSFLVTMLLVLPLSAAASTVPLVAGSLVGGLTTVNHWAGLVITWYGMAMADLIGMIILAPPIWLWMRRPQPGLSGPRLLEFAGYLTVVALALRFDGPVEPFYLLFAAHLGIAVRVPMPYTSTVIALSSAVLLWEASTEISATNPPAAYEVFLTELTLVLTLNLAIYATAVLWREISEQREELEQRVTERTRALEVANDRLHKLSSTDSLTGAWNRRYFDEHTRRELERAAHGGSAAGLLALDIDHFKRINDDYGHPAGDSVLEQVATRLDQQLRPGDMLARIGGEEFVVFLPNCGRETAREVAERLCAAVAERPMEVDGTAVTVTVSIGVTVTRPADDRKGRAIEELLRASIATADQNLYEAKHAGRARVYGP